jgi:Asp-tRNA(Asn)/Glu-tRNA(Gln) amidotransferase C subunit
MNFDILMHQILQLCRFKITMKKIRKVRFKILKIIALVDEMQSFLSYERDENASDLMRKMKIRAEATIKQINLDMKKITNVMKKMTINVNNLVNCVFMTVEAKKVSSKITSALSASVMSMIDFATTVNAVADAQSYVTSFFEFLSFAFTDRSFLNKCLYCFSKNHLYKRNCKVFNDDLISNKVHLQDKRVHLESYLPDAQHVRMMKKKSQR